MSGAYYALGMCRTYAVSIYEQRQVPIWQKQKFLLFGLSLMDCFPRIDNLLMSLHAWRKTRRAEKSDRYFDFIRLQFYIHKVFLF